MTTLNLQVAASSDDALEDNAGNMTLDGGYPLMNYSTYWFGLRLADVSMPSSAEVETASLQMYLTAAHDEVHVDVYCEDSSDAGTFTTDSDDISSRSRTSAKADWDQASAGVGWESVDIATPVQEVVDGGGIDGGLAIIIDGQSGVDMSFWAWDVSTSNCPKLDIDYSAGAAGRLVDSIRLKSLVHGGLTQCI